MASRLFYGFSRDFFLIASRLPPLELADPIISALRDRPSIPLQ